MGLILALTFYIHEYYGVIIFLIYIFFNILFFYKLSKNLRSSVKNILTTMMVLFFLLIPFLKLYYDKTNYDKVNNVKNARFLEEVNLYSSNIANYLFSSDENFIYKKLPVTFFIHKNKYEHFNYIGLINIIPLIFIIFS